MSLLGYFFLFAGMALFSVLAAGSYFFFIQYKTFLKVLEPFHKLKMPQLGLILTLCFLFAVTVFTYFSAEGEALNSLYIPSVLLITVALGVAGLIPQSSLVYKTVTIILQMAACAGIVFLFVPETFLTAATKLPYEMNFALCVSGVFAVFRLNYFFNTIEGYFLQQSFIIGVFFLAVILFSITFLPAVSELFALMLCIFFGGIWFYFAGIKIYLSMPALNMLSFIFTVTFLFLVTQGKIASAILLGMYPLTELFIFTMRWLIEPLTRQKPKFLYQDFLAKNIPEIGVMMYVFKRNCIFIFLSALAVRAQLQYQPILLGIIISLDFYTRSKGALEERPKTLRGIFKQMKQDAKEDFQKSKEQILQIKEKYAHKNNETKADNDNDGR